MEGIDLGGEGGTWIVCAAAAAVVVIGPVMPVVDTGFDFLSNLGKLNSRLNVPFLGFGSGLEMLITCIGDIVLIRSAFSSGVNVLSWPINEFRSKLGVPSDENRWLSWCAAKSKSRIIGTDISEGIRECAVELENRLDRLDQEDGEGALVDGAGVERTSISVPGRVSRVVDENVNAGS
jgi:hypothetical protein